MERPYACVCVYVCPGICVYVAVYERVHSFVLRGSYLLREHVLQKHTALLAEIQGFWAAMQDSFEEIKGCLQEVQGCL